MYSLYQLERLQPQLVEQLNVLAQVERIVVKEVAQRLLEVVGQRFALQLEKQSEKNPEQRQQLEQQRE